MGRRGFLFALISVALCLAMAGCAAAQNVDATPTLTDIPPSAETAEPTAATEPPPTETQPVTETAAQVPTTVPDDTEAGDDILLCASLDAEGLPCLTWERIPGATTYRVYRTFDPRLPSSLVVSTNKLSFTDIRAPMGLTLYYHIRAVDDRGSELSVSGYVSAATVFSGKESLNTRYVSIPKVWLYEYPDEDASAIPLRYMDTLLRGASVYPDAGGTWYRVFYYDELYYLLIEKDTKCLTNQKSDFRYTGNTFLQQQVLDLAMDICTNRKTAYRPGRAGSINADGAYEFSCSGLVTYIFNTVMQPTVPTYSLPANLESLYGVDKLYNFGYPGELRAVDIGIEDLQPGDVLFFTSQSDGSDSSDIGHCGIYLGNGEFIHSTSAWYDSVCIIPLTGGYLDNLQIIRRYLPDAVTSADTPATISGPYKRYKVYSRQDNSSRVLARPAQGDRLTILFTNNGGWAYVRTEDGTEGYFPIKHLK